MSHPHRAYLIRQAIQVLTLARRLLQVLLQVLLPGRCARSSRSACKLSSAVGAADLSTSTNGLFPTIWRLPWHPSESQIAPGSEDLYILKSEVIPPVCPACPTMSACPRQEPCTPCPPCARCPEPSFECKKVPNYSTNDDSYLPRPVLADFSQFGA